MITSAMRKIGALSQGEVPTASESSDGLASLNAMLESLALKKIFVYYDREDVFNMVGGQASYTIGTGGNFSMPRPNEITGAFVRDAGFDYPLSVITQPQYAGITVKGTLSDHPEALYYEKSYPLGRVFLYQTPLEALPLHLHSSALLQSFANLTDVLSLPAGYERMIIFNLAVDIAGDYSLPIPESVSMIAKESRADVAGQNIVPMYAVCPASTDAGRSYNVLSDSWQ